MLASQLAEPTWLLLPHDMGVLAPAAVEVLRKEIAPYSAMLMGPVHWLLPGSTNPAGPLQS